MKEFWINEYERRNGKRKFGAKHYYRDNAVKIFKRVRLKLVGRWHVKLK